MNKSSKVKTFLILIFVSIFYYFHDSFGLLDLSLSAKSEEKVVEMTSLIAEARSNSETPRYEYGVSLKGRHNRF